MAEGKPGDVLISFKSGHYKKIEGALWDGDSVWSHFEKRSGGMVHVNKEEVEYMETFEEARWPEVDLVTKEDSAKLKRVFEERANHKDPIPYIDEETKNYKRPNIINDKRENVHDKTRI